MRSLPGGTQMEIGSSGEKSSVSISSPSGTSTEIFAKAISGLERAFIRTNTVSIPAELSDIPLSEPPPPHEAKSIIASRTKES